MILYSTKKVAEALGYDQSHIRRLIKSGVIKAIRFGRDWAIPQKEFTRLEKRQERLHPYRTGQSS